MIYQSKGEHLIQKAKFTRNKTFIEMKYIFCIFVLTVIVRKHFMLIV